MTAPLVLLVLLLPAWLLPGAQPQAEQAGAHSEALAGASLESRDGLLVLRLSGSPYQMGYQHGSLLGDEIRARLRDEILGGVVLERGVSHTLLLRYARQTDFLLPIEYREELRGLADGAGISYSQALLVNVSGEALSQNWTGASVRDLMLSLSPRFFPHFASFPVAGDSIQPTLETVPHRVGDASFWGTFAVFGAATRDGRLIHGGWFVSPPVVEDLVLVVCRPAAGNSFLALGRPGTVGFLAGLNEEGLSVMGVDAPSQDASLEGIPLSLLLREALQYGGDIPTALRILVGDGKRPDAQAVEYSAHLMAVFPAESDLTTRTEHYMDGRLAETQRTLSWWDEDRSWQQMEALLNALEPRYGRLDVGMVGKVIAGLVAAGEGGSTAAENLLMGIILDSQDLEIWLVTGADGEVSPGVSLEDEL